MQIGQNILILLYKNFLEWTIHIDIFNFASNQN